MCSEQFHFILAFFSSEAPFGFVQLAPYREGVKVSGNIQGPFQRSDERIPLTVLAPNIQMPNELSFEEKSIEHTLPSHRKMNCLTADK